MKTKLTFLIIFLLGLINAGNAQLYLKDKADHSVGAIINVYGGQSTAGNSIYLVLNGPWTSYPYSLIGGATSARRLIYMDSINDTKSGIITDVYAGASPIDMEYNYIKYNLGTTKQYINVPLLAGGTLEQFPLILVPTTAGTETGAGTGNIRISTKRGSARASDWNNTNYIPSGLAAADMTHFGTNISQYTIDRFWLIDANGYQANLSPAATMTFTYINAEWASNGGNLITQNNLRMQQYNTTIHDWLPLGTSPLGTLVTATPVATTGQLQNVTVAQNNFFRIWASQDNTHPLPIELLKFEAACDGKNALLKWSTATETNNDFFTIERSTDAANWSEIGTVNGAGNSTQTLYYQFTDNAPLNTLVYYRLKQTDFNGDFKYCDAVSSYCDQEGVDFVNIYPNPSSGTFSYVLSSSIETEVNVKAYDALGQKVIDQVITIEKGVSNHSIETKSLINGVYYLKVETTNGLYKGQKQFLIN